MSHRIIAISLTVASLFMSIAGDAKTYWNGARYVGDVGYVRRNNGRNEDVAPVDVGVQPSDFTDKASFLKAYIDQELLKLTPKQRVEDRRMLGGENSRKYMIRREGERRWNAAEAAKRTAKTSNYDAAAKAGLVEHDDGIPNKYLRGLPLTGLFGINLGDEIKEEKYERIGESSSYAFTPEKKFRKYSRYIFSLTPISRKVYGIRASGMSLEAGESEVGFDMRKEWQITKSALERKFNKEAIIDIGTMVCPNFRLVFPGKDNKVEREIQVVFGSSITAVDLKLKALADEERQVLSRKQIDEDASKDMDAL